jgi:hypothetical protein
MLSTRKQSDSGCLHISIFRRLGLNASDPRNLLTCANGILSDAPATGHASTVYDPKTVLSRPRGLLYTDSHVPLEGEPLRVHHRGSGAKIVTQTLQGVPSCFT